VRARICKDEATRLPTEEIAVTLSPLLLEVLVCPECKSSLTVDETSSELVCDDCGLIYPIRDGIPIMLVSAARRPDGEPAVESTEEPETAEPSDDDPDSTPAADDAPAADDR
jgi:uncharacterized protein YbaR (Trm112 family)